MQIFRIRTKAYCLFTSCGPANTAGPAVWDACNASAQKGRRAGKQGRKGVAAPQTQRILLSGTHAMPVPEKTEVPVSRDAKELRPRKHSGSCCRGSMRCPCPKRPKCRLAGTQTTCGPANTAGPAVAEACNAHARKDRRAG